MSVAARARASVVLVALAGASGCAHRGPAQGEPWVDCALAMYTLTDNGQEAPDVPCDHRLDLDGDGVVDRVWLTANAGQVYVGAVLGRRGAESVSRVTRRVYGEPGEAVEAELDLLGLVDWRVVRRDGDGWRVEGVGGSHVAAPDALGDALWVTGSDAAALLYRTHAGWVLLELGY